MIRDLVKLSQTIGSSLKMFKFIFLLSLKKFLEEGSAARFGQLSFGRTGRLRVSYRVTRVVSSEQNDFRTTFQMRLIVKRLFQRTTHPRRRIWSSLEIVVWTRTWARSLDCNAHHATRHHRRKELLSASIIQLRSSNSQTWLLQNRQNYFQTKLKVLTKYMETFCLDNLLR